MHSIQIQLNLPVRESNNNNIREVYKVQVSYDEVSERLRHFIKFTRSLDCLLCQLPILHLGTVREIVVKYLLQGYTICRDAENKI